MSCRLNWPLLRQKREGLQQEAAQVTAELAGLEERRRGAEAAFQRIDRLHADLERRVLVHRAAADRGRGGARAAHRESAELAQREQELAAVRAEALALAQTLAAQAQALRQQLATMETN
jgi:chromosome segregation protein